jgi:Type I phosphodiesterase / nucleotide pyrophosphatase
MINAEPLARFRPLGDGRLLRPIYADYAFANIPSTVEFLLTGEAKSPLLPADCFGGQYPRPQKLVLILIDAFGWECWQHYQQRFRATRRVVESGTLTPISALFPSTTAAAISTLHLGALPSEHALYEWNIYVPDYGEVIQSLAFCPLGRLAQDACLRRGYDPAKLLAVHGTLHQRLAKHGVRSLCFAHRSYADSAYNRMVSAGAEVVTHHSLAEGLVQLKEALLATPGKAWLNFYWAGIDTMAHVHGPASSYHVAEIASFWHTFDAVFAEVASPDTLFLFTADHGHVRGRAQDTFYLNEHLPQLVECLSVSPTGKRIYPNGSPRDVFLHITPERRQDVLSLLHRALAEMALVLPIDVAIAEGLFGDPPLGRELRRRLGDILILPYGTNFLWWREPNVIGNTFNGHHGGLSREELITVIGAVAAL